MQLTIPAFAAATFAVTFAFAPVIANVTSHFGTDDQPQTAQVSSPAKADSPCSLPVARIVTALGHTVCK
jgi:hypothetical protein